MTLRPKPPKPAMSPAAILNILIKANEVQLGLDGSRKTDAIAIALEDARQIEEED